MLNDCAAQRPTSNADVARVGSAKLLTKTLLAWTDALKKTPIARVSKIKRLYIVGPDFYGESLWTFAVERLYPSLVNGANN